MDKPFRFKQFQIHQDQCAMKVGTDGVTLGAWCTWKEEPKNILDIGAGTGLISLMLAQRTSNSRITSIEIDEKASAQAINNITLSPFDDRVSLENTSLQEYSTDQSFDLIVSNPPFFTLNENTIKDSRQVARQNETLSFETLLFHCNRLLVHNGSACFILPYNREKEFIDIGIKFGLFASEITQIQGNSSSTIKRSLIKMQKLETETKKGHLIIEEERHVYTAEYKILVKDFYLNL